jgi:hypothetical protein
VEEAMNGEFGRKWSFYVLRYCPGICLEGLKKTMENTSE